MSTAINLIENRPHKRYIRYLLTKRYASSVIKRDLQRLGLSSTDEKMYREYWLEYVDPIAKKRNVSHLYSDYKSKLLAKDRGSSAIAGDYMKMIFKFSSLKKMEKDQINFIRFLEELEVLDLWLFEIVSFYGEKSRSPVDKDGEYVIKNFKKVKRPTFILESPHRYVIDEMLLDDTSLPRISQYMRDNYALDISFDDIKMYRNVFFSIAKDDIIDKIKILEIEKAHLEEHIVECNNMLENADESDDITIRNMKKELQIRRQDINENLKHLGAVHSSSAYYKKMSESEDYSGMMDIAARKLFARFSMLDEHKDRDIVNPLTQVVKTMGYAMEKANEFKTGTSQSHDRHSKGMAIELITARVAEKADEEEADRAEANTHEFVMSGELNLDNIEGIDELNIMVDSEDEK